MPAIGHHIFYLARGNTSRHLIEAAIYQHNSIHRPFQVTLLLYAWPPSEFIALTVVGVGNEGLRGLCSFTHNAGHLLGDFPAGLLRSLARAGLGNDLLGFRDPLDAHELGFEN